MSHSRIAVVTGGNKGIGLAIVRNLALEYPSSSLNNGRLLIYLTARNKERGEEALRNIHADQQLLKASALTASGGSTDIQYRALDITDSESIRSFGAFLKDEHPSGIDIAVNNAGVAMDGFNSQVVKRTLACNYYGTLEATQMFLGSIREGGRLVNVSSSSGRLSQFPDHLASAFRAAAQQDNPEAVTKLMVDFAKAVNAGSEKVDGWPSAAYSVSKAGCTAMTMAVARAEQARAKGILVNACCPGYVNTDMTKGRGMKTPDSGAKTPVKLALGDVGGQTGKYWLNERVREQ